MQISEAFIKWFESRGISKETIYELGITDGPEFMPQTGKVENANHPRKRAAIKPREQPKT